ncbi:MAG: GNAT family protein [Patescibacteria group bacterium]
MEAKAFLEGDTLILRPLAISDLEGAYISWLNDPEVNAHNSHHVFPYTEAQARAYVERVSTDEHNLVLAIVAKDSKTHIGNISLQHIDFVSHSAEYAILIGDRAYWGKGVAAEASRLLLKHGFTALNLHRIYCGTSSENIAMQKLAAKLGFVEEGKRREAHYKNGAYTDIIEYGLLASEFSA